MGSSARTRARRSVAGGLTAWLLATGLLAACSLLPPNDPAPAFDDPGEWVGGTPEDAAGMVDDWFEAVQAPAGDLGWSLVHPGSRGRFSSEDGYRKALEGLDWSRFAYRVTGAEAEDGEYRVEIEVTGGPSALDELGLVQYHVVDGVGPMRSSDGRFVDRGDGFVVVRIGLPAEGAGIQSG